MKTKKNYSFSKYVIVQVAIYTCIILSVFIGTYLYIDWRLENSFLVLDDFLKYKDKLEYEDYAGIPMSKFPYCDFAVYDYNNELIYTTDSDTLDAILGTDLEFVNDYDNVYYETFSYRNKNNEKVYKIYQTMYDDALDEDVVLGNVLLDENLNILEGNLFSDKKGLTEKELNLIYGYYNDEQMVEKYEFLTKYDYDNENGGKRTLLFMSPMFNSDTYDLLVSNSKKIWFISIPLLLILILIETYFFNKKIRRSLSELKRVVNCYQMGDDVKNYDNMPKEFVDVAKYIEELMQANRNIEAEKIKIYEDKQKTIANLSHDLKTPLTVIQGYSKAFLDGVVVDEKKHEYMEAIYKKAIVASDSIDALFLYARLSHPEYKLVLNKKDIVVFTKNYLADKYNEINKANMELEVDINISKLVIDFDERALRRIYDNLINNSLKYNKSGTKIYFKMWVDDSLYISIGDDGVGIDEGIKDNVFDAFVTSNSARTSGDGTGLGLSIVKSLVEFLGGEIVLVKKPKKPLKTEFLINIKI